MEEQLGDLGGLNALDQVTIPDLWQQEAVSALREGMDVVVQAPTGSGKTLIFELWSNQGRNGGQAIYTVPTRALANDKLAEWRARGWDAGIATGDLSENLDAPIIVATLETQKNRLIRGDGPSLLVVDEYQMIGDPDRGLNYELALALAPPQTQLLLLSGSVSNPQQVVQWLIHLGRKARLVQHDLRPVPLEEVFADSLNFHLPREIHGYWPRFTARALSDGLGPILIFSPHRKGAEKIAHDLARQLPNPFPLELTDEQRLLVGEHLAKLLKARVAYHHSGLSYAVRAGVIEPLAKAGQLRAVAATMGLAAGINFSMRSVALAGDSYRREHLEQPLRPDEILQMIGRAGRRGIDSMGYFLISANGIRLREGYACHLSRSGMVDWSALLRIMDGAAAQDKPPFEAAVEVQKRLFTTRPIYLGVESSLKHPNKPCELNTDPERARHVRRKVREIMNSRGEWEPAAKPQWIPLRNIVQNRIPSASAASEDSSELHRFTSILCNPEALKNVGHGELVPVGDSPDDPVYGRRFTVADLGKNDRLVITKWVRRQTNWKRRQVERHRWDEKLVPLLEQAIARQHQRLIRLDESEGKLFAVVGLEEMTMKAQVDRHGVALWKPEERRVLPSDCASCDLVEVCRQLPTSTGTALLWKRLQMIDEKGCPTRRGRIVSFFAAGNGMAIVAGLEDESYPLDDLVYDLANLDAGHRFCQEEDRLAGRLAVACREMFGFQTIPGYLENGIPPGYGSGAETIVAGIHKKPGSKHRWAKDLLGDGDIDRIVIEWRSLMRQIAHAPEMEWDRWNDLQYLARSILNETRSPTLTELPRLTHLQTRRIEHKLFLRRH